MKIEELEQLEFRRFLRAALEPPPQIKPSVWAEQNFWLSKEYSSQPGPLKLWPFQIEPLDCLDPAHPCNEVVLMCASQLLKTQISMIFVAYVISVDPGPILSVFPRDKDRNGFSKKRLTPMLRDVKALKGIVAEAKAGDSKNTIDQKLFRGGSWTGVSVGSAQNLASESVRYTIEEEADRFQDSVGDEGDPEILIEQRTSNYEQNCKRLKISTPKIDGRSRIQRAYNRSDQRKYHVPCPHCAATQVLEFEQLKWVPGKENAAWMECLHCGEAITEGYKWGMLSAGKWIADNPSSRVPGFHISQLYSPIKTWGKIIEQYLKSQEDENSKIGFANTVLARTWKINGDAPDWEIVKGRSGGYEHASVPDGVLFLTAGIDVQRDRIEVLVYGWARKKERWVVEHVVLEGRTEGEAVWLALSEFVERTWRHPSGAFMGLERYAIDSGDGNRTSDVYAWALTQPASRCMVVKGSSWDSGILGGRTPLSLKSSGRRKIKGHAVWQVNVSALKFELYGVLRAPADEIVAGPFHCPSMHDEFFRQLTAETYVINPNARFGEKPVWTKIRVRNEILDLSVYARAAHESLGAVGWNEDRWVALEYALRVDQASFDFSGSSSYPPKEVAETGDSDAGQSVGESIRSVPAAVIHAAAGQSESWIPKRKGWL